MSSAVDSYNIKDDTNISDPNLQNVEPVIVQSETNTNIKQMSKYSPKLRPLNTK